MVEDLKVRNGSIGLIELEQEDTFPAFIMAIMRMRLARFFHRHRRLLSELKRHLTKLRAQ